ncbi:MAG TPA: hypothetical protein PKD85_17310 [Saprospiraceae bacterium]|nr:hypothetical protein [Saprospiraceae bacterium]
MRIYVILLLGSVLFMTHCTILKPKTIIDDDISYDIKGNFDIVEIDKLNYIYTQSENNLLRRHQIDQKTKIDYVDNRLGKIDDLDPFDPLNILLFYQSYGIVKVMDNTLNVIKIINFRESSIYQNVVNICSSNDGRYWIFDEVLQKIIKINVSFDKIAETNRLSDLGINTPQIIKMRESNNQLFVLIKDVGVLVFDNFGQFVRKIVVPKIMDFTVVNGVLFYVSQNELYKVEGIDTRKADSSIIKKIEQGLSSVKLNNQFLIAWYKGGVNIGTVGQ